MSYVTMKAVHHVRLCLAPGQPAAASSPAVRPRVQDVPPGALFTTTSDVASDLVAQGAAILLSEEDQAPPKVIDGVGEEKKRRGRPPKVKPVDADNAGFDELDTGSNATGDDVI
jgi:hypothetical protein